MANKQFNILIPEDLHARFHAACQARGEKAASRARLLLEADCAMASSPINKQMAAIKGKLADLEASVAAAKVIDPVQLHLGEFQQALKRGDQEGMARAMGAAFAASRALDGKVVPTPKDTRPTDIDFDDLMVELDGEGK